MVNRPYLLIDGLWIGIRNQGLSQDQVIFIAQDFLGDVGRLTSSKIRTRKNRVGTHTGIRDHLKNLSQFPAALVRERTIGIFPCRRIVIGYTVPQKIDFHESGTLILPYWGIPLMPRAAFYLACGSAVASLVSIFACQTLLAASLLALLLSRQRLRFPPILAPLILFVALTLVALLLSPDPRAGLPQLKKFYVFLMLPVVYTTITRLEDVRRLVWWWAAAASASGLWSFVQFWMKRQAAMQQQVDFYTAYVGDRTTGFLGHWMTFGGAQMSALMLLVSVLVFAPPKRYRSLAVGAALLILGSIILGWTRSVWLATAVSFVYLVAMWRPKYLLVVPLALLIGWFVAPRSVRQRAISIYQPNKVDSNLHRYVTSRTGLEMIKAHPWFGLGPDMPGKEFDRYVPSDIQRPLPEGFYGHLHNVYLQYAAERGLPALGAFLWMIGKMIQDWWKRAAKTANLQQRAILHGCLAALFALLIEAFFEHNLGDSEVLSMFWIIVAWAYTAVEAEA